MHGTDFGTGGHGRRPAGTKNFTALFKSAKKESRPSRAAFFLSFRN